MPQSSEPSSNKDHKKPPRDLAAPPGPGFDPVPASPVPNPALDHIGPTLASAPANTAPSPVLGPVGPPLVPAPEPDLVPDLTPGPTPDLDADDHAWLNGTNPGWLVLPCGSLCWFIHVPEDDSILQNYIRIMNAFASKILASEVVAW